MPLERAKCDDFKSTLDNKIGRVVVEKARGKMMGPGYSQGERVLCAREC